MRLRTSILWLLGTCLILGVPPAAAQLDRGGITGVVSDESGAVVPQASVTIRDNATRDEIQLTTDTEGRYNATLLRVSTYTVTAQGAGFQRTVQLNVSVGVNQVVRVDLALKLGVGHGKAKRVEATEIAANKTAVSKTLLLLFI